jgi:ribosome biogenesis GTPase
VIVSIDPTPELATLERLLSLAWDSGAKPILVLTKADTSSDPSALAEQLAEVAPGVPVYAVSAEQGTGLEPLRPLIASGMTLGLLGASGAGKSTLVNALAGAEVMATQATRHVDGKGRHTTTFRALVPVPGGGAVLDTPGIRGIGLLDGVEGVEQTFADVVEIVSRCRFANCGHNGEPGCAVAEALEDGTLTGRRWDSWRKLQREIAFESRRQAVRQRSQAARRSSDRR